MATLKVTTLIPAESYVMSPARAAWDYI